MELAAHKFLDQKSIPYQTQTFPESTEKGAANVALALGFRERQMVKTLIFEIVDSGEKVLVMVGGDQSIKSGLLKKAVGSRNIKLANPETVEALTGYQVGSIPPFHWQPPGFRSFLEASLMAETELGVGAGEWGHEIIMAPRDLVQATQAVVVALVP